ncbi:MAG: chloride channel protein [Bacteroidaceae bacterium]|nr:chloride channel protein [Bacteroidaceae bacterium]
MAKQKRTYLGRAFSRLMIWSRRGISERQFMLLLAFVVGILTALAGLFLKWLIAQIQYVLTHQFSDESSNLLYLLYPVVGIFLTSVFIRRIVRDDIGHGVTKILFALARKQSYIKVHNCWSSVIASAITIGFGGSVGAEAPIVLTGSAIGSNLGRAFRLNSKQMMLLVGCGAAGAVAGIFKAPIAGLVFVLEVLMIDLTMSRLVPLLVSCVTAATVTFALSGWGSVFECHIDYTFMASRIPADILLGILCGLVSLYFTRTMNALEEGFRRLRGPYARLAVGGAMLSVLIFLFPSLYGEGYDLIQLLLNGQGEQDWLTAMNQSLFYGHNNLLLVYLSLVVVFKVFAATATNGGGGCGGIFAPSLFLGCIAGFVFARFWNLQGMFDITLPENTFALLGMCGLMSGVMHAPLTGIFLIAELTGGYQLFVPLMIVSIGAYVTINIFEPHSIYAMRLARRGELLTHNTDRSILTLMSMDSVIDRYSKFLTPEMTLGEVVSQISVSKHNVFPVLNGQRQLVAVLYIDDIRHIMFRTELYQQLRVKQLMVQPAARLSTLDEMEVVVKTFSQTGAWTLPVVDSEGRFVGFIRKSRVFTLYRQMLADISNE